MATKRFKELKALSAPEIATRLREIEGEWFKAKLKQTTGQLENPSQLWKMRKDVARLKTLVTQSQTKR